VWRWITTRSSRPSARPSASSRTKPTSQPCSDQTRRKPRTPTNRPRKRASACTNTLASSTKTRAPRTLPVDRCASGKSRARVRQGAGLGLSTRSRAGALVSRARVRSDQEQGWGLILSNTPRRSLHIRLPQRGCQPRGTCMSRAAKATSAAGRSAAATPCSVEFSRSRALQCARIDTVNISRVLYTHTSNLPCKRPIYRSVWV